MKKTKISNVLPGGAEPENFRKELQWVLAEQIKCFTAGESSSVPTETAEKLFESILYTVAAYLRTVPDPGEVMQHISPRVLFQEGRRLLETEVKQARQLWAEVKKTRIPTGLIVYNATVDQAMQAFFQTYDLKYAAHENGALLGFPDYPLLEDDQSRGGILYIKQYLEQLERENEWCARFRKNQIRAVLLIYGKKYHLDYHEMIINIPEVLLETYHLPKPEKLTKNRI